MYTDKEANDKKSDDDSKDGQYDDYHQDRHALESVVSENNKQKELIHEYRYQELKSESEKKITNLESLLANLTRELRASEQHNTYLRLDLQRENKELQAALQTCLSDKQSLEQETQELKRQLTQLSSHCKYSPPLYTDENRAFASALVKSQKRKQISRSISSDHLLAHFIESNIEKDVYQKINNLLSKNDFTQNVLVSELRKKVRAWKKQQLMVHTIKYNTLQRDYKALQMGYKTLQRDYNTLKGDYDVFRDLSFRKNKNLCSAICDLKYPKYKGVFEIFQTHLVDCATKTMTFTRQSAIDRLTH